MYKIFALGIIFVGILSIEINQVEATATATATTTVAMTATTIATSTIISTSVATSTGVFTATTSTSSSTLTLPDRVAVEKRVREYFADTPVMIDIAKCESSFRQFADSGAVFKGGNAGGMIGIFQFFDAIHSVPALVLGFDINTVEGNIGYAKELYKSSGSSPWSSCVPKVMITTPTPTSVPTNTTVLDAQTELRIKLMMRLIELLQQLLALQMVGK